MGWDPKEPLCKYICFYKGTDLLLALHLSNVLKVYSGESPNPLRLGLGVGLQYGGFGGGEWDSSALFCQQNTGSYLWCFHF